MAKRKVLLRFDDICPTMNWEQWERAKKLLDSVGATALLGVIPDCQDPALQIQSARLDFWDYIKQLQKKGYAIAMHGYKHVFDIQSSGLCTLKKHSEFAGHDYQEQYRRINEGKRILNEHGIETDIFFAPAHSYDDNTLKALYANGFRYISDGRSLKPYIRHGILCIPERSGGIPKMTNRGGYYTVVLHAHEWIREDRKHVWKKLVKVINDENNRFVSFEDFCKWPAGFSFVQRIFEKTYKVLASIKRKLL